MADPEPDRVIDPWPLLLTIGDAVAERVIDPEEDAVA